MQSQNLTGSGGPKLDQHSDLFEYNLGYSLCSSCLILDAKIDLTDKTGKKLPLNSEIYTHHILVSSIERPKRKSALVPTGLCPGELGGNQLRDSGISNPRAITQRLASLSKQILGTSQP